MNFRMPCMNKVMIAGNLVADPSVSYVTDKKIPVVNFKIACNKSFKTTQGERKDKATFINVVAWSKLAEICIHNLRRGDGAFIEGELQNRMIISQSGKTSVVEVLANRIQFLTRKDYVTMDEELIDDNDKAERLE